MSIEFMIPSRSETCINVNRPDGTAVEIEVVEIMGLAEDCKAQVAKAGGDDWLPWFCDQMRDRHKIDLSTTVAAMLIATATQAMELLKKSCLPLLDTFNASASAQATLPASTPTSPTSSQRSKRKKNT